MLFFTLFVLILLFVFTLLLAQTPDYGNRIVTATKVRWVNIIVMILAGGVVATLPFSLINAIPTPVLLAIFAIGCGIVISLIGKLFIRGSNTSGYNIYQENFFSDRDSSGRPNLRIYNPGFQPRLCTEKFRAVITITELEEFSGSVELEPQGSVVKLSYFGRIGIDYGRLQDLFYLNDGNIAAARKKAVKSFEAAVKRWLNENTSRMTKDTIRDGLTDLTNRVETAICSSLPVGFVVSSFALEDIELTPGAKKAQETSLQSDAIHNATMAILKAIPGMTEVVGRETVLTGDGAKLYDQKRESVEISVGLRDASTRDINIVGLEGLDLATKSRLAAEIAGEEIPNKKGEM